LDRPISNITLLGSDEKVQWSQAAEALTIKAPAKSPNDIAIVFKVYGTVRQPSAPFPDATGVVPQ
jgi:hypothetical protein